MIVRGYEGKRVQGTRARGYRVRGYEGTRVHSDGISF